MNKRAENTKRTSVEVAITIVISLILVWSLEPITYLADDFSGALTGIFTMLLYMTPVVITERLSHPIENPLIRVATYSSITYLLVNNVLFRFH